MERLIDKIYNLLPWITPGSFDIDICLSDSVTYSGLEYPIMIMPTARNCHSELVDKVYEKT